MKLNDFGQLKNVDIKTRPVERVQDIRNLEEKPAKKKDRRNTKDKFSSLNLTQKCKFTEVLSEMLDIQGPTNVRTKITNVFPFKAQKPLYIIDWKSLLLCPNYNKLIKSLADKKQKTIVISNAYCCSSYGKIIKKLINEDFYFTIDINGVTDFNVAKTLIDEFNTIKGFTKIYTDQHEITTCISNLCEVESINIPLHPMKLSPSQIRTANLINTKDFNKIIYWFARVVAESKKLKWKDTLALIHLVYEEADQTMADEIDKNISYWSK